MSRTLITIGTHANAGLNTFRMCFSKAQAVRILMARGIPRHAARYAVNRALAIEASGIVAGLRAAPCGLYVQSRARDAEAGYFARSYNELKALWQKAPEQ